MMGTNNMHRSASLISLGKGKNSLLSRPKALDRQRSDETSAKSREKKKMRRFSDSNGGGGGTPHHNSSTSSSPRLGGGGLRKSRIKRSLSGVLCKNS